MTSKQKHGPCSYCNEPIRGESLTNDRRFKRIVKRFWSNIDKDRIGTGCWEWVSYKSEKGYGFFYNGSKLVRAHRFAYELLKGPVPDKLQLDHLCRNPSCVNPDHLEVVTNRTNTLRGFNPPAMNARKTHCPKGHPLSGDNLTPHYRKKGYRECRTCARARIKAWEKQHPHRRKQAREQDRRVARAEEMC